MKKIIMAAGIAASMLFATSAFAETTNSIKPDYNPTSGKVTLTGEGVKSRATTTYLVISLGKTAPQGIYAGDITDTMIKQINQGDGTSTVEEILVGAGLDDGFYEVRMGGDGNVAYGTFQVGGSQVVKRILGDVVNDSDITTLDTIPVINHVVEAFLTGDDFKAADTDKDSDVTTLDTIPIVNYVAGEENTGLGLDIFIK